MEALNRLADLDHQREKSETPPQATLTPLMQIMAEQCARGSGSNEVVALPHKHLIMRGEEARLLNGLPHLQALRNAPAPMRICLFKVYQCSAVRLHTLVEDSQRILS